MLAWLLEHHLYHMSQMSVLFQHTWQCHATVMLAMQQLMNVCIVAGTLASKTFAHCAMYHLLIYIR